MAKNCFLAIDLGASSGRAIVGSFDQGELLSDEVYRFTNGMEKVKGKLTWNVELLFNEVKRGIQAAFARYSHIESIAMDTWGVDYVLLRDDQPVYPCYAYRDGRTEAAISAVHKRMPFNELYARTGVQFQPFNTIYQLYEDQLSDRLNGVTDFLMIPEYLMWRLTGVKAKEYTNATTTGLVNAWTRQFDPTIIANLDFPQELFKPLSIPGTMLGPLLPNIANEVGGQTKVVLCATHDTASAVEGIPMEVNAPFISSGTWSLLGVKLDQPLVNEDSLRTNFTNEGGVGYIRYLKNIMGLWIIQSLQTQINRSFNEMVEMARSSNFVEIFDVNDPRLIAPKDMRQEILSMLQKKPTLDADLINCVYHSLAESYRKALIELERNTGSVWNRLYVTGGGAKNDYLNELTGQYSGKEVISLPIEATALGNLRIQMEVNRGKI